MLVLVLSLHTFVRMPEIAKKKRNKKEEKCDATHFYCSIRKNSSKDSIGIRKGGSQSLVFTEY